MKQERGLEKKEKEKKKLQGSRGGESFHFKRLQRSKNKHEGSLPAVGASQRCGRALGGTPQLVYPSRFSSYRF